MKSEATDWTIGCDCSRCPLQDAPLRWRNFLSVYLKKSARDLTSFKFEKLCSNRTDATSRSWETLGKCDASQHVPKMCEFGRNTNLCENQGVVVCADNKFNRVRVFDGKTQSFRRIQFLPKKRTRIPSRERRREFFVETPSAAT